MTGGYGEGILIGNYGIAVLAEKDKSEGIALAFSTNLLKRSLSIIKGNTLGNNINVIDLVRDLKIYI